VNVSFCPSCRGLVLADFRFCPYCGSQLGKGPDLAAALEGPFARIEGGRAGSAGRRFAELEARLDRLEADMDLILEGLERAERGADL